MIVWDNKQRYLWIEPVLCCGYNKKRIMLRCSRQYYDGYTITMVILDKEKMNATIMRSASL